MNQSIFCFFLGILTLFYWPILPPLMGGSLCLIVALLFLMFHRYQVSKVCAGIFVGMGWFIVYSHWFSAWNLPLEGQDVTVVGDIVSIPEWHTLGSRFNFSTEQVCWVTGCERKKMLIRLGWYQQEETLDVGQRWQFVVRLKRPRGMANPGSFDYAASMAYKGIQWVGSVRKNNYNQLLGDSTHAYPVTRLRYRLVRAMTEALPTSDFVGILSALSIGVTGNITTHQWQIFRETGTSHLMGISGLHIGMMAMLMYGLTRRLWCHWPRLLLRCPAPRAASMAGIITALGYSIISGFSIPTQRALVMIVIVMSAQICCRPLQGGRSLLLALGCVAALNPYAVLSPGFWLSFSAIVLIGYGLLGVLSPKVQGQWLRVQWAATLGLMPLTLFLFQQTSLIGALANLVAIPWVSFVVVPLSLLGCLFYFITPVLGQWTWWLADQAMQLQWFVLEKMAHLPLASWRYGIESTGVLVAALVAVLLILGPKGLPGRWLAGVFLLPLAFVAPLPPANGSVRFTVLDVGQGLSAVVQTAHHLLIFDAGPHYGVDYDAGSGVVAPYLRARHLRNIDALVISHGDDDHRGGTQSLYDNFPIKHLITSVPELFSGKKGIRCEAGQSWEWDDVQFQFLYPFADTYHLNNDSSCVLQVKVGEHRLLLPGDIEAKAENYLVERSADELAASTSTILVAAHHGSRTSSTPRFLAALNPQYVIFPVGYYNRYHFPHPKIVARYQERGTLLYDTVRGGALTFEVIPGQPLLPPKQYRKEKKHWWWF